MRRNHNPDGSFHRKMARWKKKTKKHKSLTHFAPALSSENLKTDTNSEKKNVFEMKD